MKNIQIIIKKKSNFNIVNEMYLLLLIVFFLSNQFFSHAQLIKNYNFDYQVNYDLKLEKNSKIKDFITLGNSQTTNYQMNFWIDSLNIIVSAQLLDYELKKTCNFEFKDKKVIFDLQNIKSVLNDFKYFNLGLSSSNFTKYYTEKEIQKINENEYNLLIFNYKNDKKKKLKSKALFHIIKSEITDNQFYTTRIRNSYKTELEKLDNIKGIVKSFYLFDIKTNEAKLVEELIEIKNINFTFELNYNHLKIE